MGPILHNKSYLASICYAVEEGLDHNFKKLEAGIKNFEKKLIKRVQNEGSQEQ